MQPPTGAWFALSSAPLETNFDASPIGSKLGTAREHFIQWPIFVNLRLASWGDASLERAAASAGIQTVHYADYRLLNVLGVYVQLTVIVSGD